MICPSEIITRLIYFHQIHYWHFKLFYVYHIKNFLNKEFPNLPSYNHFIELIPRVIYPTIAFLNQCLGQCSGLSFIDATKLPVCDNIRIHKHKTFQRLAKRGKNSTGLFFGFKRHIVINDLGEITTLSLTQGDVHDTEMAGALLG